ncbi:MAG: type I pullulanase [Oscillospiraceae bacterium]|nr:type I pullulanase [Oscillospiraceae bacterium]
MKKSVLSRAVAFALAALLLLGCIAVPAFAAEDGVVIKLHYNRPDGNYADWSVWFWIEGVDGADIPLENVGGEMVATYPVASGATNVGFIVKLPNWAAKDVDKDQFIDVAPYLSGTVHVYVEAGVEGYELKEENVISGIKVKDAVYKEGVGIQVSMTAPVSDPASAFALTGPEGKVAIQVEDSGNGKYVLLPETSLDLYGSYTLTCGDGNYEVKMPNVYSTAAFEAEFTYEGDDLGAVWAADKTAFRLWAPTADSVTINLYEGGTAGENDLLEQLEMAPDVNGTWVAEKEGDLNGIYYTYEVDVDGKVRETVDPYARTTGVNGQRAMVIDLDATDPEGWENDVDPHAGSSITDAIIYELHVRDLSVDESSGIQNKGKFLGLIETGTTNANNIPTGLDHIKTLGITHIHLLPSYDYASVDESKLENNQFNWGYDPQNYNVPEGSYSTDPYNGAVRVKEMKQMVKGLHDNGISVIMDVVYNHVYNAETFCFNQIVPQYFSRVSDSGVYSAGSGCGNDTASERSMVKKYIVDSVKYWADEYHIDGFRFDLVGLIDTETINAVMEEVHKTHPNVIFYGEGWTMSTSVTKEGYTMTTQANSTEVPGFAFFSDTLRDSLRGSVFNNTERGYASGMGGHTGTISDCFMGAATWCKSPTQTVNYASCHDNMSLFDRLTLSNPEASTEDLIRYNNLAAAIYMTSQGVPFFQAGEEMLRSKPLGNGEFDHNSYCSPDSVNSLKWDDLNDEAYQDVYRYYQGLIAFRKAHPALRMTEAAEVSEHITKLTGLDFNVTGFHIASGANGEENEFVVIFNPRSDDISVTLPEGAWTVYINADDAGTEALSTAEGTVTVEHSSAMVLVKDAAAAPVETAPAEEAEAPAAEGSENGYASLLSTILAAAIAAAVVLFFRKNKKK